MLIQGLISTALFLRGKKLLLLNGNALSRRRVSDAASTTSRKIPSFGSIGRTNPIFLGLAAFGLLVANSFLWNFLAGFGGKEAIATAGIENMSYFLIATAIAAFYEEMLYRWYGPQVAASLFPAGATRKKLPVEIFLLAVFALSHGYGGWLAVGNAFVAALVLRLSVQFSGGPWVGFSAHLLYNLLQFALLIKPHW